MQRRGNNAFKQSYLDEVRARLHDREARLQEMDACGIGYSVLSLTEPGIQGIISASEAIGLAKRANDHVYKYYPSLGPAKTVWWPGRSTAAGSTRRRYRARAYNQTNSDFAEP